ncbi:hypothetical protein CFC21_055731 [Triticum aestivum]|uniref:Uncharacterized protein n=2 Tax=Triticum aestivum TaxID=4565 RepID=A0A3B6I558_WHEAT|nr:moesin/ezrin/radixin homolog 1-like isoform X1 [Triticum aestivum]XP_044361536.1 moesin/ezrin/radixin homolog 1-like isoform X1 [Triticum aestivum]KAF7046724.1 hypothetical protein CFC21_055731 [Triticum aestivum]
MDDMVDALVLKLQSKICYHRDASVEYLEIKSMVDKLVEANKKLKDEKVDFQDVINMVIEDKENLQHDCQVIKEQVEKKEEQLETVKKELEEAKHEHVAAKKELEEEKHGHIATKKELAAAQQQLAQRNQELEGLRKKIQESEHVPSTRVTRSAHKRQMLLQGSLSNNADGHRPKKRRRSYQHASQDDNLEVIRQI